MELHKKGKRIPVLFLLALLLTACATPQKTEPTSWKSRYQMPETDLQEWCGYYARSGIPRKEADWDLHMDFILYEAEDGFYGYLTIDGDEYMEAYGQLFDRQRRILTKVVGQGAEVQVYFLKDIVENAAADSAAESEAYLGTYEEGDLLFSMRQEGEDIVTAWEKPFLAEAEESLTERAFHRMELLSCQLLGEYDTQAFLMARGVGEGQKPFFRYEEEGDFGLLIYTDEPAAGGTGIYYFYTTNNRLFIQGFAISPCGEREWVDCRYDVTKDGDTGKGCEDYEESYTYNDAGQLVHFLSEGTITDWGDPYLDTIIEVTYFYREDGTLEKKKGYYNHRIFGTTGMGETWYYDEEERLIRSSAYASHGSTEAYYIYQEGSTRPDYRLALDHFGADTCAMGFVHYTYAD